MRQTLHIFGKDVRHLRWEITLVLALTATFASSYIAASQRLEDGGDQLLKALLPLSWLYLIGRVIQAEALPGNKQFWLTRPYSRKSLFAAKVLFLLTFITLPMMVSDSVIVGATGFSPTEHLSGLLWEQVLRWLALVAPAMAVAAITTGVGELAGSLLLGFLFFFCVTQLTRHGISHLGVMEWLRASIAIGFAGASAAGILILEYFWRRTTSARIAAAALVGLGSLIAFLPPANGRRIDVPSISVTLDRSIPLGTRTHVGSFVPQAGIPLRVAGVPEGLTPWVAGVPEGLTPWVAGVASISPVSRDSETFGGPWQVDWEVVGPTGARQFMMINPSLFDQIKNTPVQIHTYLTLTLARGLRTTALQRTGATMVPGVGLCNPLLFCMSPFRTPRVLVSDNWFGPQPAFTSDSPFPAEFGISPMVELNPENQRGSPPPDGLTVTTAAELTHISFDFAIDNVRLADFEVP